MTQMNNDCEWTDNYKTVLNNVNLELKRLQEAINYHNFELSAELFGKVITAWDNDLDDIIPLSLDHIERKWDNLGKMISYCDYVFQVEMKKKRQGNDIFLDEMHLARVLKARNFISELADYYNVKLTKEKDGSFNE